LAIYRRPSFNEPASYSYTKRQEEIIKQDKINMQTSFDPVKQLYPTDLFILRGFDSKAQPVWERNPRWHDAEGFYGGRSN
jgi:hypothetical protein